MLTGTVDYSVDSVVEVLDAVDSGWYWREGQPPVKFRSLVLLALCCFAGGISSSVAPTGLFVRVRSGQGHGDFLAWERGPCQSIRPGWRHEAAWINR